jgi:hypothetical protein
LGLGLLREGRDDAEGNGQHHCKPHRENEIADIHFDTQDHVPDIVGPGVAGSNLSKFSIPQKNS